MRGPTPKDPLSTDWPLSAALPFASALPTALKVILHATPVLIGSSLELNPSADAMQLPELLYAKAGGLTFSARAAAMPTEINMHAPKALFI